MADGSLQASTRGTSKRVLVRYPRRTQNNTRYPINRLPFVNWSEGRYWSLPPSSGYGTGCDMGTAAAEAFMKALRASPIDTGGCLQRIVLDLARQGFDLDGDDGRKGQVVGFFSYLDAWLRQSAKLYGSALDDVSEKDIETTMTRAANESEEAYTARYRAYMRDKYDHERVVDRSPPLRLKSDG